MRHLVREDHAPASRAAKTSGENTEKVWASNARPLSPPSGASTPYVENGKGPNHELRKVSMLGVAAAAGSASPRMCFPNAWRITTPSTGWRILDGHVADDELGEVRGHRRGLVPDEGGPGAVVGARLQIAVGDRGERPRHVDAVRERRLVGGVVVRGEPSPCAVGLVERQHAVVRRDPTVLGVDAGDLAGPVTRSSGRGR